MKYIYEFALLMLASFCFVLFVLLGIDAEIARRDFESGKAVQNCMFNFVCERYMDTNV